MCVVMVWCPNYATVDFVVIAELIVWNEDAIGCCDTAVTASIGIGGVVRRKRCWCG